MIHLRYLLPILPLLLAACVGKPQPPVTEYALSPRFEDMEVPSRLPLSLRLASISASQIYLGTDIYYVDGSYRRNPYAYHRWVDSPVRMLQLVMQDGLERSRLFRAVLPPSSLLRADLRLEATLHDFSHHLETVDSEAVLRMSFHLLDARKGVLLASRQFEIRLPADQANAQGAVAALNGAVAALMPRLVNWLQESLDARAGKARD